MPPTPRQLIDQSFSQAVSVAARLARTCAEPLLGAAEAVATALRSGGKVLLFGNGGSAADAQHIAAELVGRFRANRPALAAIALTTDTSILTAVGNDYGFEEIFARQIAALGRPGDVAIAISTSGRSPNVLRGVEEAKARSIATIALTGFPGRPLADLAAVTLTVRSTRTDRIQECHAILGHMLCEVIEALVLDSTNAEDSGTTAGAGACGEPAKVVDWDELLGLRARWRTEGLTVVWSNGCFDLLHAGHVRSLVAARAFGDVLVVGVNSDASVRRIKGGGRPLVPAPQRAEVIAALAAVDHVVVFDEDTPEEALRCLQPEVHCKGADYAPPSGKPIPEAAVVAAYGGRIEYLPLVEGLSTSALVELAGKQRR